MHDAVSRVGLNADSGDRADSYSLFPDSVTYHVYKPTLQKVFEMVFCNVNTFAALTLEKISAFKCGDVGRVALFPVNLCEPNFILCCVFGALIDSDDLVRPRAMTRLINLLSNITSSGFIYMRGKSRRPGFGNFTSKGSVMKADDLPIDST